MNHDIFQKIHRSLCLLYVRAVWYSFIFLMEDVQADDLTVSLFFLGSNQV